MKKTLKITAVVAIVVLLSVCCVACVPNSYKKAVKNLEDAGYLVSAVTQDDGVAFQISPAKNFDGSTAFIVATHENEGIIMIYFESSKQAKASFDKFKEKYVFAGDDTYKVRRQGKVIYAATYDALKAVR